jgi:dipeptidase D
MRREYSGSDEGITVEIEEKGIASEKVLSPFSQQKVLFFLVQIPNGIQKMSGEIEGLVETSMNPGILKLESDRCRITAGLRSSLGSARDALSEKVQYLTEFLGGTFLAEGSYPAWEYKKDSRLRVIMEDTYEEVFGEKPEVKVIHAGLECGLFYEKIPGLDCVSFGPTMYDIHTTEERLSISSTEHMWRYLRKVLENIKSER